MAGVAFRGQIEPFVPDEFSYNSETNGTHGTFYADRPSRSSSPKPSRSRFSVDNSVRLDGGSHKARQALAHYIARSPLSLQKLIYDALGGKILYFTPATPHG
jgi:hypothetical protein